MDIFCTRLRELRIAKGYTIKQVSTELGLTRNAVCNYEQGIREPSFAVLVRLCKFFGVSADYLLGLTDDN